MKDQAQKSNGDEDGHLLGGMAEADARFRRLALLMPDGLLLLRDGEVAFANPSAAKLLGEKSAEELIDRSFLALVHPASSSMMEKRLRRMEKGAAELPFLEALLLARDGSGVLVELGAVSIFYEGKSEIQIVLRDLARQASTEEQLRDSEALYQSLVENLPQNVFRKDLEGRFTFANQRFCATVGKTLPQILGKTDHDLYPLELAIKYQEDDHRLVRLGGVFEAVEEHQAPGKDKIYVQVVKTVIYDSKRRIVGVQGIFWDVTAQKKAEEELTRRAFYDVLTGLPNRALFLDRLTQTIRRTRRKKTKGYAVLFLDLDRFKQVNDSLGHMRGDELLVAFARRLEASVRPGDTIARLGGDEFTVLLEEIHTPNDVARVADRIEKAFTLPFQVGGQEVYATASMGIALGQSHERPEDLLRDADTAMYRAKERGRACYEVFDPEMHSKAVERLKMETDLRRALERAEFRLHYQPIVTLGENRIIGFEALLRWQHPERGLLEPADFLSIAEETGAILAVDLWVIREACRQMRSWQERFPSTPPLRIHVNLSPQHFSRPEVVGEIERILAETGLEPSALTIEFAESVLLEEVMEVVDALHRLKDLKVQLYLDDFGMKPLSLKRLRRPPIDSLKIHHTLVGNLSGESNEAEFVRTLKSLAESLKMGVIAEGVETEEQRALLESMRCTELQGYLISRPLPADAAEALLVSRSQ